MEISGKRPCRTAEPNRPALLAAVSALIQRKAGGGIMQALPAALRAHD